MGCDSLSGSFSLSAGRHRRLPYPKAVTIFNAPFVFTRFKLANLVSARVSLAADVNGKPWSSLYDQARLCLVLDVPPESTVVRSIYKRQPPMDQSWSRGLP